MDKSAYKVGTIDSKKYFTEGSIDIIFTGGKHDFGGEYYDGAYKTGKNFKYITLENVATGEVDIWGVEFEVKDGDSIKTDVMIMDNLIIEYNNSIYSSEYGHILDWQTLKYYDDIWHPADYLE